LENEILCENGMHIIEFDYELEEIINLLEEELGDDIINNLNGG
jgi:hypothetical protein